MKILAFALLALPVMIACSDGTFSETPSDQSIFIAYDQGRLATDGGCSRGVAWGDYDGDGDPDLYVANMEGQWNFLYQNNGNGTFKKLTEIYGNTLTEVVKHGGNSQGVNWVDYDDDGDLDLFIVNRGEEHCQLFRNDEGTGFTSITEGPLVETVISASMACWVDIDGDGDLDVFMAGYGMRNHAFVNQGQGIFESVNGNPLTETHPGRSRACACGDLTGDGLPEIYVANARLPNDYFLNRGEWQFLQVTEGHAVTDTAYSYGASLADYDNDGDLDLFVANFDGDNVLYGNDGQGSLTMVTQGTTPLIEAGASKGHTWGDFNNDGYLDIYVANGTYGPHMHNALFLGSAEGAFTQDSSGPLRTHADTSAGAAHADFDGDGDLDIFVANWGACDQVNRLYVNTTSGRNWLIVALEGHQSNRFGIGTKLRLAVRDGDHTRSMYRWVYPVTGYGSQNDYPVHFGLGSHEADSLIVQWPSGVKDVITDVGMQGHLIVSEGDSSPQTQ